jgi:hypothetical protein
MRHETGALNARKRKCLSALCILADANFAKEFVEDFARESGNFLLNRVSEVAGRRRLSRA